MIDYHSHILPGIDDGSQRIEDSIEMLRRLQEQGVDTVFFTPHFYPNQISLSKFLLRRGASYSKLCSALPDEPLPQFRLGAEVLYYRGISHLEGLNRLCAEGTNLLLLEMPFSHWGEYEVREICELAATGEVTVLLAHVERYLAFQSDKIWDRLLRSGVLFQCNAEFFLTPIVRKKAVQMLRRDWIYVLGTDTHNLTTRAPHMDSALRYIGKEMGEDFRTFFEHRSDDFLEYLSHR